MNICQRIKLHWFSFALFLLFAIYGCQTTNNITPSKSSVTNLQSDSSQVDTKKTRRKTAQASSSEKEATTTKKPDDKTTGKSDEIENRPFLELEKNVIGKWLNLKETESIEFFDDGTILIIHKVGTNRKIKGKYKFVDDDRLKVYFKGQGFYNNLLPTMHFKIVISDNEFTLIDEPDGTPTTYKRIK